MNPSYLSNSSRTPVMTFVALCISAVEHIDNELRLQQSKGCCLIGVDGLLMPREPRQTRLPAASWKAKLQMSPSRGNGMRTFATVSLQYKPRFSTEAVKLATGTRFRRILWQPVCTSSFCTQRFELAHLRPRKLKSVGN